jgi:hypothetical protein
LDVNIEELNAAFDALDLQENGEFLLEVADSLVLVLYIGEVYSFNADELLEHALLILCDESDATHS